MKQGIIFWGFISFVRFGIVKAISKFYPRFTKTLCPKEKDKLWQLYLCKFVIKAWRNDIHYSVIIQTMKRLSCFSLPNHSRLECLLNMWEMQIQLSCTSRGFEPVSHNSLHCCMCYSRVDFSQELLLIMFRVAQNTKSFSGEGTGTVVLPIFFSFLPWWIFVSCKMDLL